MESLAAELRAGTLTRDRGELRVLATSYTATGAAGRPVPAERG